MDSLAVGNLLGSSVLAVVSPSGNLIFSMVGSFNGTAAGAGVMIARYFGTRDINNMRRAIRTTVVPGLVPSLILTVLGVLLVPQILIWIDTPADVLPQLVTYFHICFIGPLGFVMYDISASILQTVGGNRHPPNYLIISPTINTVLDIVLIVAFHTGVDSTAFATTFSQPVSVLLCMNWPPRTKNSYRFSLRKIRFHKDTLALIICYGLSGGLQNLIIAIANVVVQPNINGLGEVAIIGHGAYSRIEGPTSLSTTSFTMALTTSVDRSLGVRQYERTRKDAKSGILRFMAITEVIGIVIFLGVPLLTATFNNGPQVVMFGTERAGISTMFLFLLAYLHYISAIPRGAGKPIVPMIVMLLLWCAVWIASLTVMIHFLDDIVVVYWTYPLIRSSNSTAFFLYYRRVNWVHAFRAV